MDWFIIGLIVLGIFGMFGKSIEAGEQKKKKAAADEELALRKKRAEEARAQILASGDKDLIARLRLMEAGYDAPKNNAASTQVVSTSGSSPLKTAAAVAGGMVVGNTISGVIAANQLEQALADIGATLDADLASSSADIANVADGLDFDFDI